MNSKQNTQKQHSFESLCKDLWKIVISNANISPWERKELCREHEQLTEKHFKFLADFINDVLPMILDELDDLKKAGAYSRCLNAWRVKFFSSNEVVAKLLDAEELDKIHKRAQWLDEWKNRHDIVVF